METTEKPAPDGSGVFLMQGDKVVGFRPAEGQGEAPAQAEAEQPGLLGRIGSTALDIGRGALDGIQEGAVETLETIGWAGDELMFRGSGLITGTERNYYPGAGWLTREEVEAANRKGEAVGFQPLAAIDEATDVEGADTLAGQMTSGVTQFLAGYGMVGKGLKLAKASTKVGAVAQAMAKGAVTDFVAFDAHEDRFSDFLRDNVGLRDPITEFLSADEDDSILEGKLKNAIEGLGLGVVTDGLLHFVKVFKKAKKVQIEKGDEAAAEVMNTELQLDLFDATTDPNMADVAKGAGPEKVYGAKPKENPRTTPEAVPAEEAGAVTKHNAKAATEGMPERPKRPVNTEGLQKQLDYELGLRRGGSHADPDRQVVGDLFNFGRMDADVDIKDVVNMATDDIVNYGIKSSTTFNEIAEDATNWAADFVEKDKDIVLQSLARQAEDAQRQQGLVIASKQIALSLAREIEQLAEKVHMRQASDADRALLVRRQAEFIEIGANLKSVIRGAAQTTSAGRMRTTDIVTGQELAAADVVKQLDQLSRPTMENVDDLAKAIVTNKAAGGTPATLLRIAETGGKGVLRKGMDVLNEFYINSILSGPKTHMINIISNGINTVFLPAEKMLGGALRADRGMIREGFRQYNGMRLAVMDSFKATAAAFRKGHNILDPEAAILEANGVDYRAIATTSENPVANLLINGFGGFVRLPSRFLLAGDEFFKQMNYRSSTYARLMGQASDLVLQGQLSKADMSTWVEARMRTSFGSQGQAKSQFDLDFAREATFTQPLRRDSALGGLAGWVQDGTNKFPPLKLIAPFVRTPSNILKAALQRTPVLQFASKTLREDLLSGDPRRKSAAIGKMSTGVMLYAGAYFAAVEGKITGSGPADPALRARMMETGWRPYSFVVDKDDGSKEYIEYRRVEPFATFLGVVADIVDIAGQANELEQEELAAAAIIAFTENVSSKSFVQGMVDATETLADPKRYAASWLRNYGSAMVPQSAFMREIRKQQDPVMRDVRNLVDAVKNTVPGYSHTIPARRSWITGEAINYPKGWGDQMVSPVGEAMASINPITATDWKQDKVLDTMVELEHGFSAPTRTQQGVELTEAQYSRFLELHGTIRINRRNLHQHLERVFDSKLFQAAKASGVGPDSEAVSIVQREIQMYRKAAFNKLLAEDVEVRQAWIDAQREKAMNQRKVLSGIADLAD